LSWPTACKDLLALVVAGRLDEVGDLCRVELRDPPVCEAQARGRHVADERLELGPRDEPGWDRLRARSDRGSRRRTAGAEARVDPGHAPGAVLLDQLDLAGASPVVRC
jgi:hypothetical protein